VDKIEWVVNKRCQYQEFAVVEDFFGTQQMEAVRLFHTSIPAYRPTPLASLKNLANYLGVGGIYVKDEAHRFGLNSFKALGSSYAMARLLAERLGEDMSAMTFSRLSSPETKERLGELTFVTATDGNHGRAVAWTARQLGQRAVVYMPQGTSPDRLANIQGEGAEVHIIDGNYDDAVRLAAAKAREYGWVVVQDTAWPGYEDIPRWIMQGYTTMAAEALNQLQEQGIPKPTHVFVQAGVGAMAAAVQGYFAARFREGRPRTLVLEPKDAACFMRSGQADDGERRCISGNFTTIMVGLACGEPSPQAWRILRDYSEIFAACPDWVAARGMRILGNPLAGDPRVVSGESGAATLGFLSVIAQDPALAPLRKTLGLGPASQVLLFSTEGDTAPTKYRRIVWDGEYPKP